MFYYFIQAEGKIRRFAREGMARAKLCLSLKKLTNWLYLKCKENPNVNYLVTITVIFCSLFIMIFGIRTTWNSFIVSNVSEWQYDEITMIDFIIYISIFLFISFIIWIYNRESKKYLIKETRSIEIEHMIRIGELAQGIIHDIMNPLTAISLYMEELNHDARQYCPKTTHKMLAGAIEASRRMNEFMNSTKCLFDRKGIHAIEITDIHREISMVCDIFSYRAKKSDIHFELNNIDKPIHITLNPVLFNRILVNLISNSIDAYDSPCQTEYVHSAKVIDIKAFRTSNSIEMCISDNGCGIPPRQIETLFTTPNSTKQNGTGIGLSSVYYIVTKELGGTIDVKSTMRVGTTFTITIPIQKDQDFFCTSCTSRAALR